MDLHVPEGGTQGGGMGDESYGGESGERPEGGPEDQVMTVLDVAVPAS